MIFLIDDNKGDKRRKEMGIHFVDEKLFSDILLPIDKLLKDTDLSFLNGALCILIHKTTDDVNENGDFIENSRTNVNKIIDKISDYGTKIPLVMFSNQMAETSAETYNYEVNPNCIYQIKKNLFYERLYDFLDYYKRTNKIELRIIAFGKNFKAVEISRYTQLLIESMLTNSGDEFFKTTDVKLSVFRKFFELAEIGFDFDEFIIDLEDNPITVSKCINNISLIVESFNDHNENIYGWQK